MRESTEASPPSPHRDCAAKIQNGEGDPPLLPSRVKQEYVLRAQAAVRVSSPPESSLHVRPPLSSKNVLPGEAAREERIEDPFQASVSSPSTFARPASSRPLLSSKQNDLPGNIAAATKGRTQDPLQGEKKRAQKALPKNRRRSPLVPVVGSPGVNLMLSQASPKTIGVKRASSTPSQTPSLSRRTKRRKLKSEIWYDFDPVYDGNKLMEAKCKHCKRVFVATREAGTSQCTSQCNRHLTICIPVILDPRYKFEFVELCLNSGLQSEAAKYLGVVKKRFKDLFVEYCSHDDDSTLENEQGTNDIFTSMDNPWEQWNKHVKEQQENRAQLSELQVYLEDAVHPQEDAFDILSWWSSNAVKYPVISRIAKDVLAAPATSVASESAFSTGGRILSDYRSRLLSETVEALICLQDWTRSPGTTNVNTITSDIIYGTHADIYGESDDIFDP